MRELKGSTARVVVVVTLIITVMALAFDRPTPIGAEGIRTGGVNLLALTS